MKIRNYFDCFLVNVDVFNLNISKNEDDAQALMDQLHDDLKYEVND